MHHLASGVLGEKTNRQHKIADTYSFLVGKGKTVCKYDVAVFEEQMPILSPDLSLPFWKNDWKCTASGMVKSVQAA